MAAADHARVCPFCGEPPGAGVFCAACGRNLADVERLPTRAEWAAAAGAPDAPDPAEATAAFLARMADAGNPGAEKLQFAKRKLFGRAGSARAWVIRPVDRVDEGERRGHYVPGLVLTTQGAWHRLDSRLTGYGQRDFPSYWHTLDPDPLDGPDDPAVAQRLDELLRRNGV